MKNVKAGYLVQVVSWENDGDNYRTLHMDGLTKEEALFIVKFISLNEGKFGNLYEPKDNIVLQYTYAVYNLILELNYVGVPEDFKEYAEAITLATTAYDKEAESEAKDDLCYASSELMSDLHGSSEGYFARETDKITVVFVPEEIVFQDVTSEFVS